jgi:hypothetical protein
MNDDELGRALSTALAPPDVQAVPDAGARLRERARRQRSRQWAAGGAIAAVLAVLVAVGVVRATTGPGPAPVASGVSYGHSLLRTPLTVQLADGAPHISRPPCPTDQLCPGVPLLTIDEVAGLRITELPESGAVVVVTLTVDDNRTLSGSVLPEQRSYLGAAASTFLYGATYRAGALRVRLPTPEVADGLVAALSPYRPTARTGPGRLDHPLQVWSVVAANRSPCLVIPDIPHKLVVNRLGECLVLDGPVVWIDSAVLQVTRPSDAGARAVIVVPAGSGRSALVEWSAGHAGERVAFGVGGQLVGPVSRMQNAPAAFHLDVPDSATADALVSRLRP